MIFQLRHGDISEQVAISTAKGALRVRELKWQPKDRSVCLTIDKSAQFPVKNGPLLSFSVSCRAQYRQKCLSDW